MTTPSFWSEPQWVTSKIIQDKFNECQYYEKVRKGELHQRLLGYDNHLGQKQRQRAQEPKCTRSQMILYSTVHGQPIAIVHQYKRKDGSLGGSGRPDPKRLFLTDEVIAFEESV